MKTIFVFLAIFPCFVFGNNVPDKAIGQYEAEVPAFEFMYKDQKIRAAGYHVSIILKAEYLLYRCGKLTFEGTYASVTETGGELMVDVDISNYNSIEFDMNLFVDIRNHTITMSGLNGVPEMQMAKKEIKLTKKPGRFRRL